MQKKAIDKYELITDKLVALMQRGVKPWQKTWKGAGYGNAITGHNYQGINPLIAAIDCLNYDYSSPLFIGYGQAQQHGWKIRKGSKATWLIWAGSSTKESVDEETGETETRHYRGFKWLNVFNLDCLDDSESDKPISAVIRERGFGANPEPRIDQAEALISAQNAVVKFGGDVACYSSQADRIQMPKFEDFTGAEAYYSTHIHELCHWTGHSSRLDRELGNNFRSHAYAFEELIAEIGAAFVCNELGMSSQLENHASYLESWIKCLKNDKKAFIDAGFKAQKAADFLLSKARMIA